LLQVRTEFRAFRDDSDSLVAALQAQLDATVESQLRTHSAGGSLPPPRSSALRLWKLTAAAADTRASVAEREEDGEEGAGEKGERGESEEEEESEGNDVHGGRAVLAEMREVRCAASSEAVLRQLERERLAGAGAAARCVLTLPRCMLTPPRCMLTPPRCMLPPLRCMLPPLRCMLPPLRCMLPPLRCMLPPLRCMLPPLRCMLPPLRWKEAQRDAAAARRRAHALAEQVRAVLCG
jgi:hypothetical protein